MTGPEDILAGTAYRAIQRIGRGGMGEVWEAEHVELRKRVVVKVLHGEHVVSTSQIERFRAEARVLARLSHPNIVRVSDFGWVQGRPFFVMEKLAGCTLAEEARGRGALPTTEVLAIGRQMLAGLSAAHAAGLVHRDIKPANVFYGPPTAGERHVVLLDFGLVKQHSSASAGGLTATGVVMGTPSYFAPEQAMGTKVDARTDLYSLGLVLYRLLTGHGPFEHHRDIRKLAEAHLLEIPKPPSHWVPGLAFSLDAVILRALAKRPENRFSSAEEMAEALCALSTVSARHQPEPEETPTPDTVVMPAPPVPPPVRSLPALVDTSPSPVPALMHARPVGRANADPFAGLRTGEWLGALLVALSVLAVAFLLAFSGRF